MIIKCFRCEKEVNTPDNSNADYIIAQDTIVREPRECLFALQENEVTSAKRQKIAETITVKQPKEILYAFQENTVTRDKKAKMAETKIVKDPTTGEDIEVPKYPDLTIEDNDYTWIEIPDWEEYKKLPDVEKVMIRTEDRDVKVPKYPDLKIEDSDFYEVEIANLEEARELPDIEKVIAEVREKDIQKTAIVCPECYRDTDFIIWGVHKK